MIYALIAVQIALLQADISSVGAIVYVSPVEDTWQLCRLDPESGFVEIFTSDPDDKKSPRWTPDKSVIFTTTDGRMMLYSGSGTPQRLLSTVPNVMAEPAMVSENEILYIRFAELKDRSNLWSSDLMGKRQTRLTNLPGFLYDIDYQSQTHEILFSAGEGFRESEIYVLRQDRETIDKLTENVYYDLYPRWSPDSSRIAFVSDRSGNYDIWIMDKFGKNPQAVTEYEGIDDQPAWSPDGKSIAFVSNRSGTMQIWTVSLADGAVRQLTSGETPATHPDWR